MAKQISHVYQCIFVHIPKTGGTSIESTAMFDDQRRTTGEKVSGHSTALKFREACPKEFERYFKFAFVRNPYDRLVSAFFYLSKGGSGSSDKQIFEKYIAKYNGNFKSFCLDFLSCENIQKSIHLRPQTDFICDENGEIVVDYLGRLENIRRDYRFVCQKLNFPFKLEHKRKGSHRHYSAYYTPEIVETVSSIYQKDLELLGYQYERKQLELIKKDVEYLITMPLYAVRSLSAKIKKSITSGKS
ncbi:MAG: sulfotransferase family 2 domain-containing protein [Phormidesmis sp.]